MFVLFRNFIGLSGLLFSVGCLPVEETPAVDEVSVGTVTSDIIDGNSAQDWMQQRAALVVGSKICSGTIISATHVLTAAHCLPAAGTTTVQFYNNSTLPMAAKLGVTNVAFRPGVNPFNDDLTDTNGDFADMAILTLAAPIPATSQPSPLAIFYPGSDGVGIQVGNGNHDGVVNSSGELRWAPNEMYSDDNSVGFFYTNNDRTDKGDSGGPIYTDRELQGDLWGYWYVAFAYRNKYTAVSYHLPWILSTINYQGSFSSITTDTRLNGTLIENIGTSDLNTCKLHCMQTSYCAAFNHWPYPISLCQTLSDVSGTDSPFGGVVSGVADRESPGAGCSAAGDSTGILGLVMAGLLRRRWARRKPAASGRRASNA